MLSFIGRGSAFTDKHNSAYYIDGRTLVLIDCPMSTFVEVKNSSLDLIDDIVILVTHTHSDHISGIPMLIDYCYFVSKKKITIVAPREEVRKDLLYYIKVIDGCDDSWYTLINSKDAVFPWLIESIPTTHAPGLTDKCFGYELFINGKTVIYTGDTATLTPFLSRVKGGILYAEVSSHKSDVHIYIEDALPLLTSLTDEGAQVYLMHIDDEEKISSIIRNTNIKLAPIKSMEVTMNSSETMLNEIFDIANSLYNNIYENLDDNHNDIFSTLTELGKTLGQCERASFWKWDKRNNQLWTTSATGVDKIVIPDNTGLVGKAIASKQVVITNDPYNDPDFNSSVDKATGFVTRSIMVLPVADVNGNFIGAYQLINKIGDVGFNAQEDVRKLSLAALICGLALESEVYLDDSHRDRLTKLKNRMGFYYDFSHKYSKYLEDKTSTISMFISDIDKFKSVNDTYGHNAGDDVLAFTASLIEGACDETQSVYRWGGEEFIMIMPEMDLEAAVKKAEEVRLSIMNSTINADGNDIHCTMSFGCIQFDMTKSIEENISLADGHLYTAKESGRNRVIS